MSSPFVGKSSEWFRLKSSELYFALQYDQMLWKFCDLLEKQMIPSITKLPEKRLRVLASVYAGIDQGMARSQLIQRATRSGYATSYCEKLVDSIVGTMRGASVINQRRAKGRRKGVWPKGRYPVEYFVSPKKYEFKLEKRTAELMRIVPLLSGSYRRLSKLLIKVALKGPSSQFLEEMVKGLDLGKNEVGQWDSLLRSDMIDEGKLMVMEKHIDEIFDNLTKPMEKELSRILSVTS